METKKERKTPRKKYTPEERKAFFDSFVPQSKSMKAFVEHQGEVWVKDPLLLI